MQSKFFVFPPDDFSQGMACIGIQGHYGYMNREGHWRIQPQFSSADSFSEGLAWVGIQDSVMAKKIDPNPIDSDDDWLYGCINTVGQLAIPFRYRHSVAFSEGVAFVIGRADIGWLIDSQNNRVSKKIRGYVDKFSCGLAVAELDEECLNDDQSYTFVNHSLEQVFSRRFHHANSFSDGLSAVKLSSNDKYGYIDVAGTTAIKAQYEFAELFSDGVAVVKKPGDVYRFINKEGRILFDKGFELANSPSDGMAAVQNNGKWGFINVQTGELVISCLYDRVGSFCEQLALVKADNEYSYINKRGEEVICGVFPAGEASIPKVCHNGRELPDNMKRIQVSIAAQEVANDIERDLKESVKLVKESRYNNALEILEKCYEKQQKAQYAYYERIRCWIALAFLGIEKFDSAIYNISETIEHAKSHRSGNDILYRLMRVQIYYTLALWQRRKAQQDSVYAVSSYIKRLRNNPLKNALMDLSWLIQQGKGNFHIYWMQGIIYEEMGMKREMAESFATAKLISPEAKTPLTGGEWLESLWGKSPINPILKDIDKY